MDCEQDAAHRTLPATVCVHLEQYAAKLVVESEPARLRHFHLFDKGRQPLRALHRLHEQHPDRDIHIYKGDFNTNINHVLHPDVLRPTEATFCLLDQRTFQCHWSTVCRLAAYRTQGYKMELFYFLANWWFERAFTETEDEQRLRAWWGRDDWSQFAALPRPERAVLLQERFRDELDYQFADARAIYGTEDNKTKIMYYMIHATDHPEAPKLMQRAYNKTVERELGQQLRMYPLEP